MPPGPSSLDAPHFLSSLCTPFSSFIALIVLPKYSPIYFISYCSRCQGYRSGEKGQKSPPPWSLTASSLDSPTQPLPPPPAARLTLFLVPTQGASYEGGHWFCTVAHSAPSTNTVPGTQNILFSVRVQLIFIAWELPNATVSTRDTEQPDPWPCRWRTPSQVGVGIITA